MPTKARAVALLRGINVGGKNLVAMPALVAALQDAGLEAVETYIQSGNVFFDARAEREELERTVEGVVEARFGLRIPTIVRGVEDWRCLLADAPFADAQRDRAKLLHVGHAKRPLAPDTVAALARRATREGVTIHAGALFVDFVEGAGRSKLTPASIDKAAGSPVTLRNWNTTLEIARRLGA